MFNNFGLKHAEKQKFSVYTDFFFFFFAATVSIEVVPQPSTVFQKKQGKKTIDVYWLSDDGGLISSLSPSIYLLLPRILAKVPSMVECN